MITTKTELKDCLKYELAKYKGGVLKQVLQIGEDSILKRHLILLRKAEYYTNTHCVFLSTLYRVRLSRFQNKYCIHIPLNTCGKGLRIMHVGPVLLNGNTIIGENCSIHINTALVANGVDDKAPVLGNGVVVGVGATIVGNVHIADNIAIGAGAVVTKSFDETNIAIAGVPARKVSENGRLTWNRTN